MPYIKNHNRGKFWPVIEDLYDILTDKGTKPVAKGEMNYVLSSVIWKMFDDRPGHNYGSDLAAVLDDVKDEFRRRKIHPYEDQKIKENGDL